MPHALRTLVILLLVAAQPLFAQQYDSPASGLSDRTTNRVVRLLERGLNECQAIDKVYRYDCYRQNYRKAARQLSSNAAYAPAQRALQQVEGTLETTMRQNTDPTAKKLRHRGNTFTAVSAAAVPKAKTAFIAALDDASTQLLRSSSNPGDHFARIANVLDSEKVFLRS